MYGGAVVVPLIIGGALNLSTEQTAWLIAVDLLTCGIATILQVLKNRWFGIGLPVVLGCTFTAVGPIIAIGSAHGMPAVYGAILASGLFLLAFSGVFGKIIRFFPPVVIGSVVTLIGITLIPVAVNNLAGGDGAPDFGSSENLLLGFGVLALILIVHRFSTGFLRAVAVLVGLVTGTFAAWLLGKVDFSAVSNASWFHLPEPLFIAAPSFEVSAILTMILVSIVSVVESTGVFMALGKICDKEVKPDDLVRGYRAEGIATLIGAFMNAFPYTTFSQNVGLVQLSGVKTRNVIFAAGGILMLLGLVPKIAAVTTVIPNPVLGGAMVAMFGMVIASGIRILSEVDFTDNENLLIIACSVGIGLGVTVVPDLFKAMPKGIKVLTDSGIVAGSLTAMFLHLFFRLTKGLSLAAGKETKASES
ncbi:nucleobase:cation symporter-2 family protein [Staphylospora marina]|uniref:nucleobase:cation symporter-2 family protein n=1 Tax=Staphylospora marina TaxID=2490858 RepID=UPI001F153273|nr:nucleobase:cation symporter-2 family protein [Staphylospora marina]